MLDLTLARTLAAGEEDLHVALHLHDPHLYRTDGGRRWIDVAHHDSRLSLVLSVQDPAAYTSLGYAQDRHISEEDNEAELFFRFSNSLASALITDLNLPAASAELQELPARVAIARLADMVVALEVNEQP